jgi:hypothetical protein
MPAPAVMTIVVLCVLSGVLTTWAASIIGESSANIALTAISSFIQLVYWYYASSCLANKCQGSCLWIVWLAAGGRALMLILQAVAIGLDYKVKRMKPTQSEVLLTL